MKPAIWSYTLYPMFLEFSNNIVWMKPAFEILKTSVFVVWYFGALRVKTGFAETKVKSVAVSHG